MSLLVIWVLVPSNAYLASVHVRLHLMVKIKSNKNNKNQTTDYDLFNYSLLLWFIRLVLFINQSVTVERR